MDALQPSTVECRKDRGGLCYTARHQHQITTVAFQIASDSTTPASFAHDLGIFIDESAHGQDRCKLFRRSRLTTQYSAFRQPPSSQVACSYAAGLRQCDLGWHFNPSTKSYAVRASMNSCPTTSRRYFTSSIGHGYGENPVQVSCTGVPQST